MTDYEIDPHRSTERQAVLNCLYHLGTHYCGGEDIEHVIKTANSVKLADAEIQEVVRNIKRYKEA